jgi:hypothetical protein
MNLVGLFSELQYENLCQLRTPDFQMVSPYDIIYPQIRFEEIVQKI